MIKFRTLTAAERARTASAHRAVLASGSPSASAAKLKDGADKASPEAIAMADRMIEIAARLGGSCTNLDLLKAGCSRDDLARHGPAARKLAQERAERLVS